MCIRDRGYVTRVTDQLEQRRNKVQVQLFCDVEPDPSIQTVKKGLSLMQAFRPDTIIAIGGGSSMEMCIRDSALTIRTLCSGATRAYTEICSI